MQGRRRLPILLALGLAVLGHPAFGDPEDPFVGRWETVGPEDGTWSFFEIRRGGDVILATGHGLDGTWRVEDDTLLVTPDPATRNFDVPWPIELRDAGRTLVKIEERGEIRLRRVGNPAPRAAPLVGVWVGNATTGTPVYERYGADGTFARRKPYGRSMPLRVRYADGVAEFLLREEVVGTFRRRGAELVAPTPRGEIERFRRVEPCGWYPLPELGPPPPPRSPPLANRLYVRLRRNGTLHHGALLSSYVHQAEADRRQLGHEDPARDEAAVEDLRRFFQDCVEKGKALRGEADAPPLHLVLQAEWDVPWSWVARLVEHLSRPPLGLRLLDLLPPAEMPANLAEVPTGETRLPLTVVRQGSAALPRPARPAFEPVLELHLVAVGEAPGAPSLALRVDGRATVALPAGWRGRKQESAHPDRVRTWDARLADVRRVLKGRRAALGGGDDVVLRLAAPPADGPGWSYELVVALLEAATSAGIGSFDVGDAMPRVRGPRPPAVR